LFRNQEPKGGKKAHPIKREKNEKEKRGEKERREKKREKKKNGG
jgi:hypothetical protein